MLLSDIQLFFTGAFDKALGSTTTPLELVRHTLQSVDAELRARFLKGVAVAELVRQRVWVIDELVLRVWGRFFPAGAAGAALVAVGGYGRGELHPYSDVDLLVLLGPEQTAPCAPAIEKFLAFLWDVGLEVGHSVRTVEQCVEAARQDITVISNLVEARLLAGDAALFAELQTRTGPDRIWPSQAFFEAKLREQQARYRKYHDTAYNLEPNVKEGPGGLRDLQMIGWVAKRHFRSATLEGLVRHDFLSEKEYQELITHQEFLWRVRYGLHVLTRRNENRLLFDYQQTLAQQFGYRDDEHRLAVEKLMKDYYRVVTALGRLNEMLLQLFQEAILRADQPVELRPLNKRFRVCNGFIEVTGPQVLERYPFALLEIFLLLAQHREISGVRAATIRQIRNHRHLIDDRFRADLRCRSLFMEILRQPQGVTHELRRMNRYGVLAAYLPAFGEIVGQMQYDLFHVYTVDDHTLHVVRNLRRLAVPEFMAEFPMCSAIAKRIPKPELLYLGALFHDIAKGRGGDHSELGARDADEFCRRHGLSEYDASLVAWLVKNHLIMSVTAQQKDINDPHVLQIFAKTIGDVEHLDYLYLLTVADIRATNPKLWNNWKDALLAELYRATRRALQRGVERPVDMSEQVAATQRAARALLDGIPAAPVEGLWGELDADYFLRHSADEVAWHAKALARSAPDDLPLILMREETMRGGTEIFLYARDQEHLFAITATALDQMGLNILDARIITTRNGYTLDTYIVLDSAGEAIHSPARLEEIAATLRERIARQDVKALRVSRRATRQLRHFYIPTQVTFSDDIHKRYTVAELVTTDRPGLLARVGQAFVECGVRVQNAKIATFGERVEDVFFITDRRNRPLQTAAELNRLRDTLTKYLAEGEAE